MARDTSPNERPILKEVVTSLPGLHRPSTKLPPEDLSAEDFVETCTGQDTPGVTSTPLHTVLGIVFWIGWIGWTIYAWFFSGAPFDDLGIVLVIWVVTFVITVLGIPVMRRKARNRVRV